MDNQKQPEEQFSENVLAAYSDHSPVIENVRGLYDFSAKDPEDLSFRENDKLQILEKVDRNWWVGRDREGRIGLIPRIYTEPLFDRSEKYTRWEDSCRELGYSDINTTCKDIAKLTTSYNGTFSVIL